MWRARRSDSRGPQPIEWDFSQYSDHHPLDPGQPVNGFMEGVHVSFTATLGSPRRAVEDWPCGGSWRTGLGGRPCGGSLTGCRPQRRGDRLPVRLMTIGSLPTCPAPARTAAGFFFPNPKSPPRIRQHRGTDPKGLIASVHSDEPVIPHRFVPSVAPRSCPPGSAGLFFAGHHDSF